MNDAGDNIVVADSKVCALRRLPFVIISALSNFGQGYRVTAGSALNDTCLEGSNNYGIVGSSPPSPALHNNGTRQLSKYIAGTRLLSFPLAAIFKWPR